MKILTIVVSMANDLVELNPQGRRNVTVKVEAEYVPLKYWFPLTNLFRVIT
jgi:hypothetical protein